MLKSKANAKCCNDNLRPRVRDIRSSISLSCEKKKEDYLEEKIDLEENKKIIILL